MLTATKPQALAEQSHRPCTPAAVRMRGIEKRFGRVYANDGVDFEVSVASVHGLLGHGGAGKSTLISVLCGLQGADAGSIELFGWPARIRNADDAAAFGLAIIHPPVTAAETLSPMETLMLDVEPLVRMSESESRLRLRLQELMSSTGLQISPDSPLGSFSLGDRQRFDILNALYRGARLLVLDEPTTGLGREEIEQLFVALARLRDAGTTLIFVTDEAEEIIRVCDQVTVMHGGRVVHESPVAQTSGEQLARAMAGHTTSSWPNGTQQNAASPVMLEVQGLTLRDPTKLTLLHKLDLQLRAGEIVALIGTADSGQKELLDVLSGLQTPQEGILTLAGNLFFPDRWLDPNRARQLGLAHAPEDRQARALTAGLAAWEAALLTDETLPRRQRRGLMRCGLMRRATKSMKKRFDGRHDTLKLSSLRQPRVLLIAQPPWGADRGTLAFMHARLRTLREAGCAVLLISSELDEIVDVADRVLVMSKGALRGTQLVEDCNEPSSSMVPREMSSQASHPCVG